MRPSLAVRDGAYAYALLSPCLLFFALLIAYPLVQTLFISLHATSTLTLDGPWVGLGNYAALVRSSEFWGAFGRTLVWTVSGLVLQVILGVGFALLLNQRLVLRPLARALVLFPYLLSTVVAVLVWKWLFNDLYGYLNFQLVDWDIVDTPVNFLGQSPNALIAVILVASWKVFPFIVISVMARLQTIPQHLYDAATIDGASAWGRFWDVTLPQLRPVLALVILLRAIWDFKEFDTIQMMTGGGPQTSTETLPLLVYRDVFPKLAMGTGAAVATVMLAMLLVFFLAYLALLDRAEPAS
jgi:multiple sugar transport system permease protein